MPARSAETRGPRFVQAYTVALFVVAVLAGGVAWVEVGLIDELEADGLLFWAMVLRIDQVVALVLAPIGLLTVAARTRGWSIAPLATRLLSVALVVVVPIGTALFVYWFVWVRSLEAEAAAATSPADGPER